MLIHTDTRSHTRADGLTRSLFASSIIAPPIYLVTNDLNSTSSVQSTFVASIFMLDFAGGPLAISPLSDLYGRNIVFVGPVALHLIFKYVCALSTNISMLVGFRFVSGCFGFAPITIGGGTITDIMPPHKRGKAMSISVMGPTLGPSLGPIIGGYLAQAAG